MSLEEKFGCFNTLATLPHLSGLVLFFCGNRGSIISHSLSVKLLVYGIARSLILFYKNPKWVRSIGTYHDTSLHILIANQRQVTLDRFVEHDDRYYCGYDVHFVRDGVELLHNRRDCDNKLR
jgi:hypothetical protein